MLGQSAFSSGGRGLSAFGECGLSSSGGPRPPSPICYPSHIAAEFVLELCMCVEFVFVFVLGLCRGCGLIGLWPVDQWVLWMWVSGLWPVGR